MGRNQYSYPPEYRARMVELVRAGRTPEELGREFEPTAQSIRSWVNQANLDEGRRADGLTSTEREELRRLRRENRQLSWSGKSWQKQRPGSLGRPARCPESLRARERAPGELSHRHDVPSAGRFPQWVPCVAPASALGSS